MASTELDHRDVAKKWRGVSYNSKTGHYVASIMVRRQRLTVYTSHHADRCAAAYDAAKLRFRKCELGSARQIESTRVFGLNLPWREELEDRDRYIQRIVYPMAYGGGSNDKRLANLADMIDRLFHKFRDFEEAVLSQPVIIKGQKRVSNADVKARLDALDSLVVKENAKLTKENAKLKARLDELEDLVHNFLQKSP